MTLREDGDHIYLLRSNGEVYKETLNTSEISNEIFQIEGDQIYGMAIDEEDKLYFCDAHDFVQAGSIYMYSNNGEKEKTLSSGINPNSIIFR